MAEDITSSFSNRAKFRVGGSGFTAFYWAGQPVGFAQSVRVTAPKTITNPSVIQPMDARYPLQIITPGAVTEGYLDIALLELYKSKIWDRLLKVAGVAGQANDLADVFYALAAVDQPISAIKVVVPPAKVQGAEIKPYGEIYNNCVITQIADDETIDVRTMEIVKNLTIAYTHVTRTDAPGVTTFTPDVGNLLSNYPSQDASGRGGFGQY